MLWLQHAQPNGSLDAPLKLGAGAYPAITTSATNGTAVAWLGGNFPDGDSTVHVTLLDAAGRLVRTATVATMTADETGSTPSVNVALDSSGDATVTWTRVNPDSLDNDVNVATVRPDGTVGTPLLLGTAGSNPGGAPAVTAAPGGTVWAGWVTPAGGLQIARLGSDGAVDVPAGLVSEPSEHVSTFRLTASADGAATAWLAPDSPDSGGVLFPPGHVSGVRLSASGPLQGTPFGVSGAVDTSSGGSSGLALATGAGGVIWLAWMRPGSSSPQMSAVLSRFASGQTTAPGPKPLSGPAPPLNALMSAAPALSAGPDGSLIATWLEYYVSIAAVAGARVTPEGTIGPASTLATANTGEPGSNPFLAIWPQADEHGGAIVGTGGFSSTGGVFGWTLGTFLFDSTGPQVAVDVPASAVVLTPVYFSGTVTDPADVPLTWDFGDGSTTTGPAVSHVYANPGTYSVTATASDHAGNQTAVTRQITVTPAQDGPGAGNAPPLVDRPQNGGAKTIKRCSAHLRLTKVVRTSRRVTIMGTLTRRSSGRVTITWTQRAGRKTVRQAETAKISKGHFTATIKLKSGLVKSRTTATLRVAYAGDRDTLPARIARKVKAAKKAVHRAH